MPGKIDKKRDLRGVLVLSLSILVGLIDDVDCQAPTVPGEDYGCCRSLRHLKFLSPVATAARAFTSHRDLRPITLQRMRLENNPGGFLSAKRMPAAVNVEDTSVKQEALLPLHTLRHNDREGPS